MELGGYVVDAKPACGVSTVHVSRLANTQLLPILGKLPGWWGIVLTA